MIREGSYENSINQRVEFSTIPNTDENQIDPSLTHGESRSIVSVLGRIAGQTDGSVHTEVHLLLQLQQGNVVVHYVFFIIPFVFFMDNNILHMEFFSLQECFIFSLGVVFSKDNLNNCGN